MCGTNLKEAEDAEDVGHMGRYVVVSMPKKEEWFNINYHQTWKESAQGHSRMVVV